MDRCIFFIYKKNGQLYPLHDNHNTHSAAGSIAASELQGPWIRPQLGFLSLHSFECSSHVFVGFRQVLQFLPTSQKHAGR